MFFENLESMQTSPIDGKKYFKKNQTTSSTNNPSVIKFLWNKPLFLSIIQVNKEIVDKGNKFTNLPSSLHFSLEWEKMSKAESIALLKNKKKKKENIR